MLGGIVLCGGLSSRMGQPKALLPFGSECLLQRVVRILSGVAHKIVVVAAEHQTLPNLPIEVLIARDELPQHGPLAGIAAGLSAMTPHAPLAFITSCDAPFLLPAFISKVVERLEHTTAEIAVPADDQQVYPLAAVYRVSVLSAVQECIAAQELRVRTVFTRVPTVQIPLNDLRSVDAALQSLRNLNTPDDYQQALQDLQAEQ